MGGNGATYMFDLDWLMLAAINHRSNYAPSVAPLFNADDPKIVRMFNHPPFLRAYYRTIKKAVDGPLVSANCNPVMDARVPVAGGERRLSLRWPEPGEPDGSEELVQPASRGAGHSIGGAEHGFRSDQQ